MDQYPLERKWKIWEMWNQNKQNSASFVSNMQEIGEFSSIFTFWQHWNYFPHADPTKLFEDPETKVKVIVEGLNQSIEAIGVFIDGVRPAWEDPTNEKGCDVYIRKFSTDFRKLKELWDTIVLSVIGENFPYSEEIVGCRVVDKKHNYKFELWMKTDILQGDINKCNDIKAAFANLYSVPVGHVSIAAHRRSHD